MDAINSFFSSVGQLFGATTFAAGQRALDGQEIKVGDRVLGTFTAGRTDNTLIYAALAVVLILVIRD